MSERAPYRILIIDKDNALRQAWAAALEKDKFEVFEATDAFTGFEQIARHKPHLVLCEIQMADISASDFINTLQESGCAALIEIPFIFLHEDATPGSWETLKNVNGDFHVLDKQASWEAVQDAIWSALTPRRH